VPAMTLAQVCNAHAHLPIDFMKIDVEGSEALVIESGDWERFRPRVLVIEATEPNSSIPSHEMWEPFVIERGYECVLFDGLNRFSPTAHAHEPRDPLARPANALDAYEPWRWIREIESSKEYADALNDEVERANAEVEKAQRHVEMLHEQMRALLAEARLLHPR